MGQHFDKLLIATTLDWFAGIFLTNAIFLFGVHCSTMKICFKAGRFGDSNRVVLVIFGGLKPNSFAAEKDQFCSCSFETEETCLEVFSNVFARTLFIVLVFQDGWEIPWISDGYTIRVLLQCGLNLSSTKSSNVWFPRWGALRNLLKEGCGNSAVEIFKKWTNFI